MKVGVLDDVPAASPGLASCLELFRTYYSNFCHWRRISWFVWGFLFESHVFIFRKILFTPDHEVIGLSGSECSGQAFHSTRIRRAIRSQNEMSINITPP